MKLLLNRVLDTAILSSLFRSLLRYAVKRAEGHQYGSYDLADEAALAASFLKTTSIEKEGGGVIVDAGANKGGWSRMLMTMDDTFEKLVVIEPASPHHSSLNELLRSNDRVAVEHVAIGAEPGKMTLFADAAGSGLASVYQRDLTHIDTTMVQQEVVTVTTLDCIAEKHKIKNITFLKLDLEGHELEALKGSEKLLSRKGIAALAFEFGGCNIDSRTFVKDFWFLLVYKYNYKLYRVLPNRRLKRLSKYSEALEQFTWQNLLACAPGVRPEWKVID